MRPTVYLTAAAALAAASLLSPNAAAAQDAGGRRTYETLVQGFGPGGVSVWRGDDSTRADISSCRRRDARSLSR